MKSARVATPADNGTALQRNNQTASLHSVAMSYFPIKGIEIHRRAQSLREIAIVFAFSSVCSESHAGCRIATAAIWLAAIQLEWFSRPVTLPKVCVLVSRALWPEIMLVVAWNTSRKNWCNVPTIYGCAWSSSYIWAPTQETIHRCNSTTLYSSEIHFEETRTDSCQSSPAQPSCTLATLPFDPAQTTH